MIYIGWKFEGIEVGNLGVGVVGWLLFKGLVFLYSGFNIFKWQIKVIKKRIFFVCYIEFNIFIQQINSMKNKYFKIYYKELKFLYSRFNFFYILD